MDAKLKTSCGCGVSKLLKCLFKSLGQKSNVRKYPSVCLETRIFLHTYLCGNCAPVPTPSSPDKAISANSVKSPLNKEKR